MWRNDCKVNYNILKNNLMFEVCTNYIYIYILLERFEKMDF